MSAVESTMLALGTAAPDFSLPDVRTGDTVSLATFADKKALLVMFLCPHCPYVLHVQATLAAVLKEFVGAPLGVVAICSNDAKQYPADGPEGMRGQAAELGFDFPYCRDESQSVAHAYTAACTPDFFLFDGARALVYRGQMDGSRPKNDTPVTGADLRAAIDAVLGGRPVHPVQRPSIGCNIKWKPGQAPRY